MDGFYPADQTFNTAYLTVKAVNKWGAIFTNGTAGGGFALYPSPAHHIIVDGLCITNCQGPGILAAYGTNNTFRNLWIKKTGLAGTGTGDGLYAKDQANIIVENCLIELCGARQGFHHGIYIGGTNCIVRNNVVRSNYAFGIQLNVTTGFIDQCQVYNNLCYSNAAGGSAVYELAMSSDGGSGSGTNFVFNNTFRSRDTTFAYVSRNTVQFTNNIYSFNGDVSLGTAGVARLGSNLGTSSSTNFVDVTKGLWWLSSNSAARNIANLNSIPPIDFFGTNQTSITDVGAFQYSAAQAADTRTLAPSPAAGANYWLPQ
jgi:hypothetical protein